MRFAFAQHILRPWAWSAPRKTRWVRAWCRRKALARRIGVMGGWGRRQL